MDRILCGSELPSGKTVMTPNDRNRKDRSDENIERELRLKRPFSLGEAVAREGGSGLLGGASPIAHQRQVELAAEDLLDAHLDDSEGALRQVLLRDTRRAAEAAQREESDASQLLRSLVAAFLDSDTSLTDLVRRADAEWGRLYEERPHFDHSGVESEEDDPYTVDSVRAQLETLLDRLGRARPSS
jgi:hypothetical protein